MVIRIILKAITTRKIILKNNIYNKKKLQLEIKLELIFCRQKSVKNKLCFIILFTFAVSHIMLIKPQISTFNMHIWRKLELTSYNKILWWYIKQTCL